MTASDGTRQPTVEPAHEALLRQWGLLQGWLQEDLGALTTLEAVKRAARDWAANDRSADWLNHAGGRLEDAGQIAARPDFAADLSDDARDYLRHCREAEAARRRERDEAQIAALRHARRVLSGVTVGLVAVLAFAGIAGWQWRDAVAERAVAEAQTKEAEAQRARAQHSLALATDTANALIFDIAQKFRDSGVPASIIADILARARQLQDQLVQGGESSPDLRRSQASGLEETARELLTIGDTEGALAAAKQARGIWQALLASAPDNTEYQIMLSVSDRSIGDVLQAQADLAGALTAYRDSLAITKALTEKEPGNTLWQDDLAVCDEKIGDMLLAQGDLAGALAAYRDSLAIRKALAEKDPANGEWWRDLSVSDTKIGDALQGQRDLAGALAAYRDSLAIAQTLAAKDPGNAQALRDLADVLKRIGSVQLATGDAAGALESARQRVAVAQRILTTAAPDNIKDRTSLAGALGGLAWVLVLDKQPQQALDAANEALTLDSSLLFLQSNKADALLLLGRFDEAKAIYLANTDKKFPDGETFAAVVRKDFATMRKFGIDTPDMKRIGELLAG